MATAEKAAEVRQKLGKDTTDLDESVNAAIVAEQNLRKAAEQKLRDMEQVLATPDKPQWMPERWGDKRLTIATPGHMKRDPFFIPEYVTDAAGTQRKVATHRWIRGQFHILTSDGRGKYRWCSRRRIPVHKMNGFEFARYSKLFEGTGLFESGSGDTVWNGDAVLMYVSLDGYDKFRKDVEKLRAFLDGATGNEFFNLASNAGVHSFKDDMERGVREFYT